MTSERYGTVGHLVFDVVLFVLLSVVAVVHFATRRGSRLWGGLCLAGAVMMLGVVLGESPFQHQVPSRISAGLVVVAVLILCLGPVATIFRHRQTQ